MIDGRRVFSTSGNKGNRWIGARITTVRVGFARVRIFFHCYWNCFPYTGFSKA